MNREPLQPITQEHIDTYNRDGVVVVRGMFDRGWIDLLRPVAERVIAMDEREKNKLGAFANKHLWHGFPEFREYCFESPAAEIVGRILQSREIRFFSDQVWAKPPHSNLKTPWHTDRMGWPVDGVMVPSFWMAVSNVVKANSLECIAGSHKDATRYWNKTPNSMQMIQPADRPHFIDYDQRRDDPSLTFLSWDMEPGDALLIHPWCYHYSCGNPTPNWRIAVPTRWFGDDIRWNPRPESLNHPGYSFEEMVKGEKPEGPLFPVIWRDQSAAVESVARCNVGYFGETGLGSEVGASFATDQDRVLGPVDPNDPSAGIEGEMMLVERDVRPRLVPASEVAAQTQATEEPMSLADVRTDEDAVAWLRHIVPATPGPTAVLVFKDGSDADPVAVCFSVAAATKPCWARVGDVAMSYIAESEASPFDRPGSRGLLDAILRMAKSCDPLETASPEAIQHALAARLQHPGWQLIARAISSPESATA